jgi:hypothetical protein
MILEDKPLICEVVLSQKVRSLSTEVMDEMHRLMDKYKDEELSMSLNCDLDWVGPNPHLI